MRIELNVTLACNRACPNCNRLCHIYKNREEHVTLQQVDKMKAQIRESDKVISRIKVAGGEPLLNPEFKEIYYALSDAIDEGLVEKVKIDSNGSISYPKNLIRHPKILHGGKIPIKKIHLHHLYKQKLPQKVWGLNEVCQYCVFGMPDKWKKEHAKPLSEQYNFVSVSWQKAIANSNGETTINVY